MRIAQIVLPGASEYERKCQRVDLAALTAAGHEIVDVAQAEVAHVYGPKNLPSSEFIGFPLPYVASGTVVQRRWAWRRPVAPRQVVSPLGETLLPEAVEESYFADGLFASDAKETRIIGSFGPRRAGVTNMIEQTLTRIHRFRSDVTWHLYDEVPSAAALREVDLWIDPATSEDDLDGYVAEATVAGLPVVAARTAINVLRLEKGRTGWLVPPRDPNEMTHAILSALFKPEVAQQKITAARQTASKYRGRQRARLLTHMYESLIPKKR
jgi:glycosyltransferase involved in cell wall biosynthesis